MDADQGDGTAVCLANDDEVFTFSMHQNNIYPEPKETSDLDVPLDAGTDDERFNAKLNEHLSDVLDRAKADICFVVAGCDTPGR